MYLLNLYMFIKITNLRHVLITLYNVYVLYTGSAEYVCTKKSIESFPHHLDNDNRVETLHNGYPGAVNKLTTRGVAMVGVFSGSKVYGLAYSWYKKSWPLFGQGCWRENWPLVEVCEITYQE